VKTGDFTTGSSRTARLHILGSSRRRATVLELPVVKSPVFTSAFGIFGGGMSMTGRFEATSSWVQ